MLAKYMRDSEQKAVRGFRKGFTRASLNPNIYTGFQQESVVVSTGFTGIKKLEIEIDKDYDAVVGFAVYRMEGASYAINSYLSITSDEGTLISSVNSRVFFSDIDDMRKDKFFFPLFVKNSTNGKKVSFNFDIKRAHGEDTRYFVLLMLKNNVYPYPYEFDFFTYKKTLNEVAGSIIAPYESTFQLEAFPSNFTECMGVAISSQNRDAEPYYPMLSDVGMRRGLAKVLDLIPSQYLYLKANPVTSSLERFFPVFLDQVSNEMLNIYFRTYEAVTADNKYIELIFLLRRKSISRDVRKSY